MSPANTIVRQELSCLLGLRQQLKPASWQPRVVTTRRSPDRRVYERAESNDESQVRPMPTRVLTRVLPFPPPKPNSAPMNRTKRFQKSLQMSLKSYCLWSRATRTTAPLLFSFDATSLISTYRPLLCLPITPSLVTVIPQESHCRRPP